MTDYPNYKSPAARQKDRIREDIAAIDKAIESCNPKLILQMHQHIDGKYQACIAGWTQSLYGYVPGYGINYEVIDSCTNNGCVSVDNIKQQLNSFKEQGFYSISLDVYKAWLDGNIRLKEKAVLLTTNTNNDNVNNIVKEVETRKVKTRDE